MVLLSTFAALQSLVMMIADNGDGGGAEGEGEGESDGDQNGGAQCVGAIATRMPAAIGDGLLIAAGMALALVVCLTIKRPARGTQPS